MGYNEARKQVEALVKRFQALTTAQVKQYNEENTKKDFILPLFEALGWDVYDSAVVAAEEKASGGRVDYAFKLRGVSQFYLEVKPPRADLTKPEYAKQAITYAYNKGIIWAALTDFEGLTVFNSHTGQSFLNLTHGIYLSGFDDLWLLSKESFEKSLLNERAEKYGALPKRLGIEYRLFGQLRQWREELFSQLHIYNPHLTFSQIDEVILRLFNRLIFIRNCEDRRIEEPVLRAILNQWRSAGQKGELIEGLRHLFRQFDGYYDSDLFTLHPVDQVFIEAKTLEEIIDGLYEVPGGIASYDFSVIDADVLGAVYEQYLGHVAEVVKQRAREIQARLDMGLPVDVTFEVTAKRQKRKEQGIYYTPKWVVNYIVEQTIGRLLKEKTHHEILNLKILDPACGSGSFLIKAYEALLNYYADAKGKSTTELDQWDRLPVLTRNIFGVDLDMQAVEIARLSLLIRSLARREVLPSLADNIRQGNSLISGAAELRDFFGENWQAKHPFNWEQEFKDIMAHGGFDVIIGNPPYIRIQSLPREDADYYRDSFQAASGSFDIYVLFLEKGIKLLKPGGWLGFICSSKFLKSQYGRKIQQLISKECTVENIVDLSAQTVFAEATTYPAILILRKVKQESPLRYISVPGELADSVGTSAVQLNALPVVQSGQEAVTQGRWPPVAKGDSFWAKLLANSDPLGKVADRVFQGLITSADKVYILQKRGEPEDGLVRVFSRAKNQAYDLEAALLRPLLSGKDIGRYEPVFSDHFLLFPYQVKEGVAELISPGNFEKDYPLCWQYLLDNRQTLEDRENGKMRHEHWYAFGRTQNLALHDRRKLAIPRLVDRLEAFHDGDGKFYLDNVDVGGLLLKNADNTNYMYVLALLNSRLLDFCLRGSSVPFRGGFYSANRQFLEPLPIRRIDFGNPEDKRMYNTLVSLADKMLKLHEQSHKLGPFDTEEKHHLQREIEQTDREMDNLVYDLYGLTEEERKLVEGSASTRPV